MSHPLQSSWPGSLPMQSRLQQLPSLSPHLWCLQHSLGCHLGRRNSRRSMQLCIAQVKQRKQGPLIRSDGKNHLGSALQQSPARVFPGPPSGEGAPLRVLPIGGLGEIGMNCMLVGVHDRYILIDAGLMFPDFTDFGMQKILPDTTFLSAWKDKIEAVIITHGHEDHIGALPWVFPALDPSTKIYAAGFTMELIRRRLQEFNLYDADRCRVFNMGERFRLGPFECEPIRVTHSIPDSCGMILRSDHGTIVHTGDWKIDENPQDGQVFDRSMFEKIGNEGVTLFMSDSTNILSPGRTGSEAQVQEALIRRVQAHQGKGRVISTQFASNLHRLAGVKAAADAAGRKIAFVGMSLTTYLEAAHRDGRAPFDPKELVSANQINDVDPSQLLIVTTGSQAEERAALSLAARDASHMLKLHPSDLILYSAKVIPGNEPRVTQMMNNISALGPEIAMGRGENLHTSGHAYRDELEEVMRLVKPQTFLPVHGEYSFLCAHAQLGREVGIRHTSVIRNGQMLGVAERRNGREVSSGSRAAAEAAGLRLIGEAKLTMLYNDGNKGTGTAEEMAISERATMVTEGIVIASVDVERSLPPSPVAAAQEAARPGGMRARVRVTTRAMWTNRGQLLEDLHKLAEAAVSRLTYESSLVAVERAVADAIRRGCKDFNNRRPEVVVVAHEKDSREGAAARALALRRADAVQKQQGAGSGSGSGSAEPGRRRALSGSGRGSRTRGGAASMQSRTAQVPQQQGPGALRPVPEEVLQRRRLQNPREKPQPGQDLDYS